MGESPKHQPRRAEFLRQIFPHALAHLLALSLLAHSIEMHAIV
jgi:hypothetical protein